MGEWTSSDGLTLRYRDHVGRDEHPPLLCIPGLTRNCRDFEPVAEAFAGERRVICVDLRGRGASDYAKDSASYQPLQYAADIGGVLQRLIAGGILRVVARPATAQVGADDPPFAGKGVGDGLEIAAIASQARNAQHRRAIRMS